MNTALQKKPLTPDCAFIKRSAWLGTQISFVVLAPIGIFCWMAIGGLLLYKCGESGLSPIAFLKAIDKSILAKITDGLIAVFCLVVGGVALSAGMGAAVAAGAVGCHRLRRRIGRHSPRN
jgi:hypothetical protein